MIYSHHVRVADRWRVGRVFLAGDAAHAMPPWIGQGMSAGVRDAANLCWKLAAVLDGQAPESLLDTYQAERKPHVTEVTRRAVLVGRIITERNRVIAAVRNHVLRAITRLPGVVAWRQKITWIPDARYADGFFASAQPRGRRVADSATVGHRRQRRRRLASTTSSAAQWTVLHTGAPPAGATLDGWTCARLAVPRRPDAGAIRDNDGTLIRGCGARRQQPWCCVPTDSSMPQPNPGHPLPAPPPRLLNDTDAAHCRTPTGATA